MLKKIIPFTLAGAACIIASLVVIGLLIALPIMLLWNWLCPILFSLPKITFWQSLGLFALLRCLFPMKVK